MDSKTAGLGIVLVLALNAAAAQEAIDANPPPPPEPTAEQRDAGRQYQEAQLDLYDALRGDSSPRTQVLAAQVQFDEDDSANALRPKRTDVVARAAQLAPDDAFVQWMAAAEGNYYSSQCGPTQWPETEAGNLVRLESDNAGALLYAVALAQAKGDPGILDESLARMASATRASDHAGEEIALWRMLHATLPAVRKADMLADDDAAPAPLAALRYALQRTGFRYSSADSALKAACKPDATSERAWHRLGWCADAGRLLASRGDSFALRELGLALLDTSGASSVDTADLRLQLDWLQANAANPNANPSAFLDQPDAALADWRDAPDEITATERRLKRLGKPLTPPAGWVAASAASGDADAAWRSYLHGIVDDLRAGADARERAAGLAIDATAFTNEDGESISDTKTDSPDTVAALVDLAASLPDNRFVQWTAALARSPKRETAIARVRQLEPDNAAAWTIASISRPESAEVLHHAASATHFDEHAAEPILLLHAAFRRHPMPAELQQYWTGAEFAGVRDAENVRAFTGAMALATANLTVEASANVLKTCADIATTEATARTDCVALARLMLHSRSSLMAVMVGETTLRKFDALDASDLARARQVAWWQSQVTAIGKDLEPYIDDYLATGSEIDALQRMLARAGKEEPPADWQSPAQRRAASEP